MEKSPEPASRTTVPPLENGALMSSRTLLNFFVIVPVLTSGRATVVGPAPASIVMVPPGATVVAPVPVIAPPVQESTPLIVREPSPPIVPARRTLVLMPIVEAPASVSA